MDTWYEISSVAALLVSSYLITRAFRPRAAAEAVLSFALFLASQILTIGYILSSRNQLQSLAHWSWASIGAAAVALGIVSLRRGLREECLTLPQLPDIRALIASYRSAPLFDKAVLTPLLVTAISLGLTNLAIVLFTAPHNGDSMCYHLARVAYYIQHGNLNYYDASYWPQVVFGKNSAVLLLYTYLVSGRNENLTQLVQYISYWVAVCAVFGSARKLGYGGRASLFAALVFSLFTSCLMQATTTQNDLLIAALIGGAVYFLLAFRDSRARKYLAAAAMSVAIALGVKQTAFLAFPALGIVALYALRPATGAALRRRIADAVLFLIIAAVAIGAFTLPAGYLENYRIFGDFICTKSQRQAYIFEGQKINYIIINGTRNIIRYSMDFLVLDGLPPTVLVRKVGLLVRELPRRALSLLGIDAEAREGLYAPSGLWSSFSYTRPPVANEDCSYWGIFGFALAWAIVFIFAIGLLRGPPARVLSRAAISYFLVMSYCVSYGFMSRWFLSAAVLAAPPAGWVIEKVRNKAARAYVFSIVIIGCLSAFTAVLFRVDGAAVIYPPLSTESVFRLDRIGQLTTRFKCYRIALKKYEKLVPTGAVVAACLCPWSACEYPLFGEGLTRRIIPVWSFRKGFRPVPAEAEYLLYSKDLVAPRELDIHLGHDWYLRDLKKKVPAQEKEAID